MIIIKWRMASVIGLAICLSIGSLRADRPNIILMMADDLGYAELGSYGQKIIRTPNLDRIAGQGMRFTRHYTSAPVCAPARCSLMTGRHGGNAYVRDNFEVGTWESFRGQLPLPTGTPTMASVLKDSGYRTGAFGKWGLGEPGSSGDPLNNGFDRFFGYNCQRHAHNYYPKYLIDDRDRLQLPGNNRGFTGKTYASGLIANQLLDFISTTVRETDDPFFVYYPTVIPHLALQVPDGELHQYRGEWSETPYKGNSYLHHDEPRAAYAAMISYMDKQVGRMMTLLESLGVSKNTLFIFTSDNGTTFLKGQVDYEFFNSVNGFRGLKGQVYEGGIRVPLIVHWPGQVTPGTVSNLLSAHYDIFPTLAEAAGISSDKLPVHDGLSFLPTAIGDNSSQKLHEYLMWDFAGYGGQLAIRNNSWKLVQRDMKKNPDSPLELFNLQADPGENTNVADQNPDIVKNLYQTLINQRSKPKIERFQFGDYGRGL